MAKLPDEILVNIAHQCVEPYGLTVHRVGISSDDPGCHTFDFPSLKNVQLTSKLFANEIRKSLRTKFNGKLTFPQDAIRYINSQIVYSSGSFSKIIDRIQEIEIVSAGLDSSKVRLRLLAFPKLRYVALRAAGIFDWEILRNHIVAPNDSQQKHIVKFMQFYGIEIDGIELKAFVVPGSEAERRILRGFYPNLERYLPRK